MNEISKIYSFTILTLIQYAHNQTIQFDFFFVNFLRFRRAEMKKRIGGMYNMKGKLCRKIFFWGRVGREYSIETIRKREKKIGD